MTHTIGLIASVLVEDAAFVVLAPILRVHRIVAHELQLAEAVVPVVRTGGAVDQEGLVGGWVGELLRAFVGAEALVEGAAVRRLFPGVGGHADDLALGDVGGDGPWVLQFGDTEICGPGVILADPAGVDVVEAGVVLEVGPVDGELIKSIQLGFEGIRSFPGVISEALQDVPEK